MQRTAVVTGILGQDGCLLGELLLRRGYRVVGIARPGADLSSRPGLASATLLTTDLSDAATVRQLLDQFRPDELYHLAAAHHASQDTSASAALAGKSAMLETNFLSTRNLAFALVDSGVPCHLVYAASSQMYTAGHMVEPIDETTVRRPPTFYGHTKSWALELLAFLRRESKLRASSAILFNHESALRAPQFVSRKITQAAAGAAQGQNPTLELYNIAARVDWSSAHDVVDAMSLMGRSDAPRDCVVASGSLHSVRDWLDIAFGHVGLDWRQFATVREDRETPALLGRPDTLEQALGWQRQVSFEAMVIDMVTHDLQASTAAAR